MIDENTKLEERIKILETEKRRIESVKMSFKDAPDGARFRYPNMSGVWVKINSHPKGRFCDGNGLIVQWNGNKRGFQSYASFCDKESGIDFNTKIELV